MTGSYNLYSCTQTIYCVFYSTRTCVRTQINMAANMAENYNNQRVAKCKEVVIVRGEDVRMVQYGVHARPRLAGS